LVASWHHRDLNNAPPEVSDRSNQIVSALIEPLITPGRFKVNLRSQVRYMLSPVCLSSVCLSVTLVRPTQPVEIFGNISTAFGTLMAIR